MRPKRGHLFSDSYDELNSLIELYDMDRYIGHVPKVKLVNGDAEKRSKVHQGARHLV